MNLFELHNTDDAALKQHLTKLDESIYNVLRRLRPELAQDFGYFKQPPDSIVQTIASILTWMRSQEHRMNPAELAFFYSDDEDKMYQILHRFASRTPDAFQASVKQVQSAVKYKQTDQLFSTIEDFFNQRKDAQATDATRHIDQQEEPPEQQAA